MNLLAQITNPALNSALRDTSTPTKAAGALATYLGTLWQTIITIGGVALLIYLLLAGLNWVFAGGDKGKIESARNQITQGIIGMVVLVSIAALSIFIGNTLGINLLKPQFQNLL